MLKKISLVNSLHKIKTSFGLNTHNICKNKWRIKIRDQQILNAITQTLIHSNRYRHAPQFEQLHDTIRQQLIHYLTEESYKISINEIAKKFVLQDLLDSLNIEDNNKPITDKELIKFGISEIQN